jgi:hypothetical protein
MDALNKLNSLKRKIDEDKVKWRNQKI